MNFKKELNEIVEKHVDVTKKQSKATNIDEFVKDVATITRLNRIYDTELLLEDLYDMYEEDTELTARINKYSLGTVFAEVYSLNSCYIEYYNSGDDDWLVWINDALDQDFPLEHITE
ncbi:hypothetical protein [Ligilactobacillus salivarius]|uniref:hypothetical protein n=1 Tax=Ligilactobacillus salivarius TaxID=1624 RepID=UPI003F8C3400